MRISIRFPTFCVALLTIVLVGLGEPVVGQDVRSVTGQVIDADTGDPIPVAHVFYSGSITGDVSDANGRFQLPYPHLDQVDLVVSMLGYATLKLRIERLNFDYSDLIIALTPVVFNLGEVEIVGEVPTEWKENLIRFERLLFSTTDFGEKCGIENPEVLQLSYDDDSDSLSASADIPLRIMNGATGYQITVHDIRLDGNEYGYWFSGEMQFRELTAVEAKEQKKWREAREKIYAGSLRHFLRSLVWNRLEDEGFEAYHVTSPWEESTEMPIVEQAVPGPGKTYVIVSSGNSPSSRMIVFSGTLFIRNMKERKPQNYLRHLDRLGSRASGGSGYRQMSWLKLPLDAAEVDTSGIVFTDVDGFPIAHFGYWAWQRFGEMLPTDYVLQN